MVSLPLVPRPRVKRIVNIVVALFYAVGIVMPCLGEGSVLHILGSAVGVVLLVAIVRTAWTRPQTRVVLSPPPANVGAGIAGRKEPLA